MEIKLPNYDGLICGFRLCPAAQPEPLGWDEVVRSLEQEDCALWLHFDLTNSYAREWLGRCDRIPESARKILLATDTQIRLETFKDSIFGVLGDLRYDCEINPESLVSVLRLYVDENWIVTGRLHPLQSTDRLRSDLLNGSQIESSIQLLAHLFQRFTEVLILKVAELDSLSNAIEDNLLRGRFNEQQSGVSRMRRSLVRLRRLLSAEQAARFHIRARLPRWRSEADIAFLQREVERLDIVIRDVESLQERTRLLQEEIAGQQQQATNRNLYFLSIVTTIFLPITVISGIFGMNVGGLPWTQDALGFQRVMLSVGGTLLLVLWVLRQRRLL
jgi:zinc transporter